ncbi:Aste57867_22352 [Aphanomyces stellatus]|uniref:Aste57867_22352 protein n=1 Tax=Aphanomyces stellatus TaxID=120398 RepID=A0A485LKP9_9STRA|nr:hypothetical protein As57867_022282 [Aphanomyces stellatus]VFT99015.1 Aste57867_22352 [Aphanomyces stellatus]
MPPTTPLVRPKLGESRRDDDAFRASMRSCITDLSDESLDALVALRQSGILPGLFFRDESLLRKYILPSLSTASGDDLIKNIREAATQEHDTLISTLLVPANDKPAVIDIRVEHDGYRVVGSIGQHTVVHWRGLPDAYDTYVSTDTLAASSVETIHDLTAADLVLSSDFHKAAVEHAPMWINPLDFVVPATPSDQPPAAKKPKINHAILDRLKGDAASAVATLLKEAPQPVQDPLLYGHLAPTPAPTVKTTMGMDQPTVVVPSCSRWFSLHSIHPLEKRMLPEFFQDNRTKTPQVYMTYRNYMVNASRAAPHVYVTATACRRNLAGDACAILRVHEFLTHWGLINYHVPAHAAPPSVPSLDSFDVPMMSTKHVSPSPAIREQFVCESCAQSRVDYELTADAKRKERLLQHGMPLRKLDAWGVRPGAGICDKCFAKHKFPSHLDPSDFAAVAPLVSVSSWRDEDIHRLLTVLNDLDTSAAIDWNEVAHAVGKPAKECIAQFLKAPLEPQTTHKEPRSKVKHAAANYPYISAVADMAEIVATGDPALVKAATAAAIAHMESLNEPGKQTKAASRSSGADALAKSAKDAGMTIKDETNTHEAAAKAQTTAATAVAVLAVRAQGIAKHQDGVVKGLLGDLLQCKMQHIQLKLKSLEHLEAALAAEREQLAKERYEVYVDKLNTAQAKLSSAADTEG